MFFIRADQIRGKVGFQIRWKSVKKIYKKKLLAKMWQKYALFPHVRQNCFAYNFLHR